YNPYVTVDYVERTPLGNAKNPLNIYTSRGKRQPFGAKVNIADPLLSATAVAANSPVTDQNPANPLTLSTTNHNLAVRNAPLPASKAYDWLVHLDRTLISPMELLHVSGFQPYQLTQNFILNDSLLPVKFQHLAPWFDQSKRLYRAFELFRTGDRSSSVSKFAGIRTPGKININAIWDVETFRAICDAQLSNNFTAAQVDVIFKAMMDARSTPGALPNTWVPGPLDRPFQGLATGPTVTTTATNAVTAPGPTVITPNAMNG